MGSAEVPFHRPIIHELIPPCEDSNCDHSCSMTPKAPRAHREKCGRGPRSPQWTERAAASSRTRTLACRRRRTMRTTAFVCSSRVRLAPTASTASQMSSGVSPSSTSEASSRRGALPGPRARNSARRSRVPLRACSRHSSRTPIWP